MPGSLSKNFFKKRKMIFKAQETKSYLERIELIRKYGFGYKCIFSTTVANLKIMSMSISKSPHRSENITKSFLLVEFLIMV